MAGLEATTTEGTGFDDHGRFYLVDWGTIPDVFAEEAAQADFGSTEYANLLICSRLSRRYAFSATHDAGLPQHLQEQDCRAEPGATARARAPQERRHPAAASLHRLHGAPRFR